VNILRNALKGGKKLIAFIVAGDPTYERSYESACAIIESGADILELGLPFSDPLADGPTIQEAGQRSLTAGMNPDSYFKLVRRINRTYDTPLVCLTYYNIVLQYGLRRFSVSCVNSGIDGVIVPDLPIEEAKPFLKELRGRNVDLIFLVTETTSDGRLERIVSSASGFIYVVALLGTTGARDDLSPRLKSLITRIKKRTKLPLAVGFGISTEKQVRKVISFGADAAIVGSGIVKMVEKDGNSLKKYVRGLKNATQTRV
jgi:tryptophan synthase alpha chain